MPSLANIKQIPPSSVMDEIHRGMPCIAILTSSLKRTEGHKKGTYLCFIIAPLGSSLVM